MNTYFVGIDTSRDKLDVAILLNGELAGHFVIANGDRSIKALLSEFKQLKGFKYSKTIFCMESTGYYNNFLLNCLLKKKAQIVIENPLKIIKSSGIVRGKSDKIDSIRIAAYAYRSGSALTLWKPKRELLNILANLSALRQRLISVRDCMNVPIKEQFAFISRAEHRISSVLCSNSIAAVREDLLLVDQEIARLISQDLKLSRLVEVITSVPQVGKVTALQLIIATNEFESIRCPKKFACYAGVAPFPHESGTVTRRRKVSKIANVRMRSLLHMCALGAIRNVPEIKQYYNRKIAEGKPKLSIINAVRFKLITRVFSCVNQDRLYEDKAPLLKQSTELPALDIVA